MIITVIFCAVSLFAVIRTVSFALFTAQGRNRTGAAMLFILAALVAACAVFVTYRL